MFATVFTCPGNALPDPLRPRPWRKSVNSPSPCGRRIAPDRLTGDRHPMFPLRDSVIRSRPPVVVGAIIAVNIAVLLLPAQPGRPGAGALHRRPRADPAALLQSCVGIASRPVADRPYAVPEQYVHARRLAPHHTQLVDALHLRPGPGRSARVRPASSRSIWQLAFLPASHMRYSTPRPAFPRSARRAPSPASSAPMPCAFPMLGCACSC